MKNVRILILVGALVAFGFGEFERGNRMYREGRYAEAVEAYQAALRDGRSSSALHYNLGTALLRLGRYDEAETHLRAALGTLEPEMRERAHYNLGNRFLEASQESEDPRARAELLEAAVEAYKQALRVNPADIDAKWNLELALREQSNPPPMPQGGGEQEDGDGEGEDDEGEQGAAPTGAPSAGGNRSRDYADAGEMTPEQAERILRAAEQDERDLFRDKLRRGRRDSPVARDW